MNSTHLNPNGADISRLAKSAQGVFGCSVTTFPNNSIASFEADFAFSPDTISSDGSSLQAFDPAFLKDRKSVV